MDEDGAWRWDAAMKGLFVVVGLVYVLAGPPVLGLDPRLVGAALIAYGVVSFLGKQAIIRWGLLGR